ncbi:unnamed protein product [Camellia sinensis]
MVWVVIALAEQKYKYLRELAKLEKEKDAEIAELKKSADDADDCGYKEGEATYILQCEASKDIFFKCGWKAAVSKLGYGEETEVFQNPPLHFIPSYMADYANAIQQKLLQVGEDEASPEPDNAPATTNDLGVQTAQSIRVEPPVSITVEDAPLTGLPAGTEVSSGVARVNLDADLDNLFA